MQKIIKYPDSGIYILDFKITEAFSISLKQFKDIIFPKGYYYYIGSAQKNLKTRIRRHCTKDKKLHWHIDYLTSSDKAEILHIFVLYGLLKDYECKTVQSLVDNKIAEPIIKGFGSSDCKNCISHLLKRNNQDYNQLLSLYHNIVRIIPSSSDIF